MTNSTATCLLLSEICLKAQQSKTLKRMSLGLDVCRTCGRYVPCGDMEGEECKKCKAMFYDEDKKEK